MPALHDKVPNLPIICAGGIADGRGLAAMLALGADGVVAQDAPDAPDARRALQITAGVTRM